MKNIDRKIVAIVGPTASGKTAVGVKLAKKFNGEIVSADSRQIFRGLDLGTGKEGKPAEGGQLSVVSCQLSARQLKKSLRYVGDVPQWMIDVADPEEDYNLFKWLEGAKIAIEDIFSRGKLPIIVGGTGLYAQALLEGFELKSKFKNPNFKTISKSEFQNSKHFNRVQLEHTTIDELQNILEKIDPEGLKKINDKKNSHRLIRAIERAQSGEEMTKVKPDWDVLQIGLEWSREILNQRIDKRADDRFEQGMLDEIIGLLQSGVDVEWLVGLGLEYRIMTEFLISNYSNYSLPADSSHQLMQASNQIPMTKSQFRKIEDTPEFKLMNQTLKLRSHQYAKRQMTWFKRFPEIVWLNEYENIEKEVKKLLLSN